MKIVTKNLMYFAISFFIGAIVFRYFLSTYLKNHPNNLVWIIAVIYFFFCFFIGWFFGKRDYKSLPLYDVGFRFHFVTYLLSNIVAISWFSLDFQSQFENIRTVYAIAIFWGIGLLIHFIYYLIARKNTIKGLNKEEIFE